VFIRTHRPLLVALRCRRRAPLLFRYGKSSTRCQVTPSYTCCAKWIYWVSLALVLLCNLIGRGTKTARGVRLIVQPADVA